ncbi:MAG: hypothetical protein ACRDZQ_07640 [Acidimicrobiales bacterium]
MGNEARIGMVLGGTCIALALIVDWVIRVLQEDEHSHPHSH